MEKQTNSFILLLVKNEIKKEITQAAIKQNLSLSDYCLAQIINNSEVKNEAIV